jgi:hypothetical protein
MLVQDGAFILRDDQFDNPHVRILHFAVTDRYCANESRVSAVSLRTQTHARSIGLGEALVQRAKSPLVEKNQQDGSCVRLPLAQDHGRSALASARRMKPETSSRAGRRSDSIPEMAGRQAASRSSR